MPQPPSSIEGEVGSSLEYRERRGKRDDRFFNGPVLAASEFALEGMILASLTDYAHYLNAAQDPQHVFDCRAAFSAAALLTSDNFLLLGQMAAHTFAPGHIQFPNGGIELSAMGNAFFCNATRFPPLVSSAAASFPQSVCFICFRSISLRLN